MIFIGLIKRTTENLNVMADFVEKHDWIQFLASDPKIRSSTSVCFVLKLNKVYYAYHALQLRGYYISILFTTSSATTTTNTNNFLYDFLFVIMLNLGSSKKVCSFA